MTLTPRTLLSAAVVFIAAGALAFFGGQAIGGDRTPPPAVPEIQSAEPVIVPILLSPDDDVAAFAVELAEQTQASRETASELGVPLESAEESGVGLGVVDPVPETSDVPPELPDDDAPASDPGPPGRGTPASETVEDACADGGDGCPEGVGGTVLAAIRAIPPLYGVTYFNPPAEPGAWGTTPLCPAVEVPSGSAYFGAATSRPATITLRYRGGRWTGSGYEVEGTVTITTPDDAEGPWHDWIADDTAPDDDPRSLIHHCFMIDDLPPRGDYIAFIDYEDKTDPSVTATNWRRPVPFEVLLDSGFLPGELRRPTTLLGHGIDELLIGVTARDDHTFQAYAIPGGTAGECDTGGDEGSVTGRPDVVRSATVSDTPIAPETLADPLYPYLRDHTRSLVHRIGLTEGTDYIVCLYWFERGTTFDPTRVSIAEAVPVSTPEAYRPRILIHGFTELFGFAGSGRVNVDGCGSHAFAIEPGFRAGDSQMYDEPVELCVAERGLTALDRGIRVVTGIQDTDFDVWRTGGRWIRTSLECVPVDCLMRLDELYSVPLPSVPTERRLCGTGFGGGCSGEVPMRPAGSVAMEIEYIRTPGNGLSSWSIGVVGEFEDTPPPPVGESPRLDVRVAYELLGHPLSGARATVTVQADREVTFEAYTVGEPDCGLDTPSAHSATEFATEHTFTIEPLCLGNAYRLAVVAHDRTRGAVGTIVERGIGEVGPETTITVPPLLAYTTMSASIELPRHDTGYTVYVRAVNVSVPTVEPPYGTTLGWSWPEGDRALALSSGWRMFGLRGQANACSPEPGAGVLRVNRESAMALLPQDQITLTAVVDVHANREQGGPIGECAVGALLASHTMQVTLSLAELMAGVTLTSDSGEVVVTIRTVNWRRDLVG